jgi:hypothetical protein
MLNNYVPREKLAAAARKKTTSPKHLSTAVIITSDCLPDLAK